MGVPIVSLGGASHVARVGVSLLTHAGLPNWIATSRSDYVRIAVQNANSVQVLKALRPELRSQMLASELSDPKRFTSHLESCYRRIWRGFVLRHP